MNRTTTPKRITVTHDAPPVTLTAAQQTTLKWLAMLSMLADHANKLLLAESSLPLAWFGRLAFPLFAFLMAYNLSVRSVPARKYLAPLAVFGLISQPIYAWVWGTWRLSILATLFLAALYHHRVTQLPTGNTGDKIATHLWVAVLILPVSIAVEYPLFGPLLVMVFAGWLEHPTPWWWLALLVMILAVNGFGALAPFGLLVLPVVKLVSFLPVGRVPRWKWFFYLFYPAHTLVLAALSHVLTRSH